MRISDWSSDVCSSDLITAEVEPVGGFIGDAFAQPIFQGGTLLVYIGFIFAQDPILGAAAIALYPFQGWLIPRLQRKVNQLGKQRVRTMRQISDKIGESVGGIQDIHANRSEEHTSELQSLMRISYAVFCLKNTTTVK